MVSFKKMKKCPWTPEEDMQLVTYISTYGIWNWNQMPKHAGLSRTGKSCRLRWMNYLDPQVIRGNYTQEEDAIIIGMRQSGAGWSAIAASLPGRTDNEIKNRWHSRLSKRLNTNIAKSTEPYKEQIVPQLNTTMNIDDEYPHDFDFPEVDQFEWANEEDNLSSHMGYIGASSNNIVPPAFGPSVDPHISFWRDPFSLENIYDFDDEYATYVAQYGVPHAADWFGEPYLSIL